MNECKEFDLFLDESGDFDKNLGNARSSECVVGGFLVEHGLIGDGAAFSEKNIRHMLCAVWHSAVSSFDCMKDDHIFAKINHATDLKRDNVLGPAFPEILHSVFNAVSEQGVRFVIFSNNNKTNVNGSSDATYLNILVEGVLYTLSQLYTENKACHLHVHIGSRYSTEQSKYIPEEYYKNRLKERLQLRRVEQKDPGYSACLADLDFVSDKHDARMVVSDYICNYYFTQRALLFKAKMQVLNAFFENKNAVRYTLGIDADQKRIQAYCGKQFYSPLLEELCSGFLDNTVRESAMEAFLNAEPQQQTKAFAAYDETLRVVLTDKRSLRFGENLLNNAFEVLERLKGAYGTQKFISRIEWSLWMHREVLYSHMGNFADQKDAFDRAHELAGAFETDREYFEKYFIYYNRYAVSKNYCYDFCAADEICKRAEETLEEELRRHNDLYKNSGHVGDKVSVDLGKMYGTHVQIALNALNADYGTYDEAVALSDAAIQNFSENRDKERQYQYRADIEASVGHIDEALEYYAKGFGKTDWKQVMLQKEGNQFEAYHLSLIGVRAWKWGKVDVVRQLLEKLKPWAERIKEMDLDEEQILPQVVTAFNVALLLTYSGKSWDKYLFCAAERIEKDLITFGLQIYAEIALCYLKTNGEGWSRPFDRDCLRKKTEAYLQKQFPESTLSFIRDFRDEFLKGPSEKTIDTFANTRLY